MTLTDVAQILAGGQSSDKMLNSLAIGRWHEAKKNDSKKIGV